MSNAFFFIVFVLWVLSSFPLGHIRTNEKGFLVIKWWLIYFGLQFLYSIIGYSRELSFFMARCYIYVIPIMMVYIIRFYTLKEIKLIWLSIIVLYGISLISNIILGLGGGVDAFGGNDAFSQETLETSSTNAGSTAFVVGGLFLMPLLFLVFKYGSHKFLRLSCLIIMILTGYYILFLNSRTTAVIFMILIFLGMILVGNSNKIFSRGKKRKAIIYFCFFLITIFLFALPVLNTMSDYFSDFGRMSERLRDLTFVLEGGGVQEMEQGSLFYRISLWMTSIHTFFDNYWNFFVGIGENVHDTDFYYLLKSGVGGHSEFFDLAARYGIIGIFIMYKVWKYSFGFILNFADGNIKAQLYIIFANVFLYGFVNTLFNHLSMIMMILLFPVLTVQLLKNKII